MNTRFVPPMGGLQANAWDAATTGAGGTSSVLDTWSSPFVSAFGNVSGATTITLQFSADNSNFYDGPTVSPSGAGNFYLSATVGARYVRLKSSNSVTATATLSAK